MENKVYYGEYSLKHWLQLIMKGKIVIPEYQRYYVWTENDVKALIKTFDKKHFIPPVTIGAYKDNDNILNLIIDGQQRLTSILLAYLNCFPDKESYLRQSSNVINEEMDEDEEPDNILEWNFNYIVNKGRNREEIREGLLEDNYKVLDIELDNDFFEDKFLGFAYLVPDNARAEEQKRYFSSVFRSINLKGNTLSAQESRASLYFLESTLKDYFDPSFFKEITVNEVNPDFVRALALLAQYKKEDSSSKLALNYRGDMEAYYEDYIYSVVNRDNDSKFISFLEMFPNEKFQEKFDLLSLSINHLELSKDLNSIIDYDIYYLGLIYVIIFEGKEVDFSKREDLKTVLDDKISSLKLINDYIKSPNRIGKLRNRVMESIGIYNEYIR